MQECKPMKGGHELQTTGKNKSSGTQGARKEVHHLEVVTIVLVVLSFSRSILNSHSFHSVIIKIMEAISHPKKDIIINTH